MKISKSVRTVCAVVSMTMASASLSTAAYASVPSSVPLASTDEIVLPLASPAAFEQYRAATQDGAVLDDLATLSAAEALPQNEADQTQAGMPWAVVTALIAAGGGMAWYLLDVYYWHNKKFSAGGFAKAGGCGALGGLVWGLGGGWAGRIAWKYAIVAFGAGGIVNTCHNVF